MPDSLSESLDKRMLQSCAKPDNIQKEALAGLKLAVDTEPLSDQVNILTPKPSCNLNITEREKLMPNTTTNMLCTIAQAQALMAARQYPKGSRAHKSAQLPIMRQIKRDHRLPQSTKLKLWIANPENELYRVLRDKRTGLPLVGPVRPLTVGEAGYVAPAPAKAPAKVAKAPAKVAKAPAKAAKAPAKAPAKTALVAKFVKGKPVALSKASPVKTDTHTILMRPSIKGKKVQLGYAASAEAAEKIIAAARKAA